MKGGPAVICALLLSNACRGADSLAPLLACRQVAAAAARLACFDRAVADLAPAASAPAGASPAGSVPAGASSAASSPAGMASTPAMPSAAAPTAPAPTAPAPTSAAPTAAAPVLDPTQRFGLSESKLAAAEVAAGTRATSAKEIDAQIVRIEPRADGLVVYVLDNGQVWRQLTLEADLLLKPGDSVRISRGMLGSFWLATPTRRGCKVTRLR